MRISSVKAIPLTSFGDAGYRSAGGPRITPMSIFPPEAHGKAWERGPIQSVLVEVSTDDGIKGHGTVGAAAGAAVYTIEHHLKSIVVGGDPFDTNLLWEKMFRATTNYGRKGMALEAISAVDIAIWDIKGKALGQPVYNLLGGKTKERIPVYASRLYAYYDLDQLAQEAQSYLEQGFKHMKLRFGYSPADGPAGMRKNVDLVRAVREVIGYDVELAADVYMGWNTEYALRMLPLLEEFQLRWIEEPVIPDDIDGYARVKQAANARGILVSGGEHEFTRYGIRELIRKGAVDILQPDVNRVGGITEAQRIWGMAEAENLQVTPHAGQSHNYHLIIAHLNSPISEYFPKPAEGEIPDGNELFYWIYRDEPEVKDGYIELSGKPGLGIEVNWDVVEKYRYQG